MSVELPPPPSLTTRIPAAGTVPWRRTAAGSLQVALVHRPRYEDWSWAKGKLEAGELSAVAAVRETQEETGYAVRLGRPLPASAYTVVDRTVGLGTKEVHYWAASVGRDAGPLAHEVDVVDWLDPQEAHDRLDYARDREQLRAVVRADQDGTLDTWPLVIVRHAKAIPRSAWHDDDRDRPLAATGARRSRSLVPLLAAYGVLRLVTSSSGRCVDTLAPYAVSARRPLRLREDLSEEVFDVSAEAAAARLQRILRKRTPAALCSHGPVIPSLLAVLAERLAPGADASENRRLLADAGETAMAKGEVLVAHIAGRGADAAVVAVERHLP